MTDLPDRTDARILALLQRDGRLTNAELSQQVALSPSPCLRRVRHLEESGFIRGYVALLDPGRLGLGLQAYVTVSVDKRRDTVINAFYAAMQASPEVLSCFALTGEMDYLLHVVSEDLEHYSRFLMGRLLKLDGVANVKSSFMLQSLKNTTELPLARIAR